MNLQMEDFAVWSEGGAAPITLYLVVWGFHSMISPLIFTFHLCPSLYFCWGCGMKESLRCFLHLVGYVPVFPIYSSIVPPLSCLISSDYNN